MNTNDDSPGPLDPRAFPEGRMTLDEACAEVSGAVYAATVLFEQLEGQGRIVGNGHHARQKIAAHAVKDLVDRWVNADEKQAMLAKMLP